MSFLSFLFVEVKFVKINGTLFPMVLAIRFLADNKELAVGAYSYNYKRVWNVKIEVSKK